MSFSKTVGSVRYSRSYVEPTGGLTDLRKSADDPKAAPVEVKVTATFADDAYALFIEANGDSFTLTGVDPSNLADEIARVVNAVSKAQRVGRLNKHRQRDSRPFGIGTPESGKHALRFG